MSMPALISDGRIAALAPAEEPIVIRASAGFCEGWKGDIHGFFGRVQPYLSRVNSAEFLGRSAGTVLFEGCEANLKDPRPRLTFRYRSVPWGRVPVPGSDVEWIEYERADFTPLVDPIPEPDIRIEVGRTRRWPWQIY